VADRVAQLIADPYGALGVQRVINCCGTRTVHGGSLMPKEVRLAMEAAASSFVHIPELIRRADAVIAPLLGAEAALVTSGASASLTAATAGALTRGDPERMLRLPATDGIPCRVIAPGRGRFAYDQAIRAAGAEIVMVADEAALERAFQEPVAMIVLLGTEAGRAPLTLARLAAVARAHDIPVLVDAASERVVTPSPYLAMGAQMVAISGGKYLRGPQSTGLLIGERRWIDAAWLNAAPHHAIGRAMKVSKEEIAGLVTAVVLFAATRGAADEEAGWRANLARIAEALANAPGAHVRTVEPGDGADPCPRLLIEWGGAARAIDGLDLRERLLEGIPAIMLDDRFCQDSSVQILPFNLQPGEADVVGRRIAEALVAAASGAVGEPVPPAVGLAGAWVASIEFTGHRSSHRLELEQTGCLVTGVHHASVGSGTVAGRVAGTDVDLASLIPIEGTHLAYRFRGRVQADSMAGEVELGTSGQSAPGPLNQREFGTAAFRASRDEL
jgi:D-glucosaminate-6-phosphate ammonia-lyase